MKKVLFSLLCSAAFAVASPVSVSIVNTGSPDTLNINGEIEAAMSLDNSNPTHGSWTADITVLNGANLSNTALGNHHYFVDGAWMSSSQIYKVEAYLDSEINQPKSDRVDLQQAALTFMDEVTGNHNTHRNGGNPFVVNSDIQNALKNYSSFNDSAYEIVSEVGPGGDPTEFVVATPEPASIGLMGGALLALGVVGFRSRRRGSPSATA